MTGFNIFGDESSVCTEGSSRSPRSMTVQVDFGASSLGFRLFGHVVLRIFHDLKYDMFLFQYAVLK